MEIDEKIKKKLLYAQGFEKTEYFILKNLAQRAKDEKTREILDKLALYSAKHYRILKDHTKKEVDEGDIAVLYYIVTARILGITFCLKLLEKRENKAGKIYRELIGSHAEFKQLIRDEEENEKDLIGLIDEEALKYIGSVVLGLNDALVELTGALAGFTLAMQNNQLIGSAGLITGIAASLSMASSEYLSTKTEVNGKKSPLKAALYTGIAYVFTVIILIFPYFLTNNYLTSLALTVFNAALIILLFSYYSSVSQEKSFAKRFAENILISLGIAAISFFIGYLVRTFLHIEI